MRKALAIPGLLCLALALFAGTALAAGTDSPPAVMGSSNSAELLPVDVITNTDQLEVRKIYELSPDVDPGRLPRDAFERGNYTYACTDILREVVIGEENKTVTVTETAESKKNDMNTILSILPQYREYMDEDGFSGNLLLNTATLKAEVSGYGSSSTPYALTRTYPNLSDADTQYLPKTIDDNGRTLQLQDVDWLTDNSYNVDDYEIGSRYTAVVTYGGTKTSSYVKGYDITADYSGEVVHKGVTVIRYTVIFTGMEITPSEPASEPAPLTPEPITPELDTNSVASQSYGFGWIPAVISALALLGCGACVFFTLKNRKETPRYEKDPEYDYHHDAYADDNGGSGAGGGDV